ncbi:hypothetical protein [Rhizobium ecuadorense]|uniref:hypothetical protein n=1 Tax=Rhizobium ecuadorense TaxID=1671795 RepID=UPI0006738733|nr:hypothetical protein [Rhizobium ecuadorense]
MNSGDLSQRSTLDLMSVIHVRDSSHENKYEATESLLKRWRQGIDLGPLVNLLLSESSRDRLRGASYISELGQEVEGLNVAATRLADDALPTCRRAFVEYVENSAYYEQAVAKALAKCLLDTDLYVRSAVIAWASRTSDETFEDFSRMVGTGAGRREPRFRNPLSNDFWNESSLRRAVRGLDIIRRLREGKQIPQIRTDFPGEDSFIFDIVEFSQTRRERLARWQKR